MKFSVIIPAYKQEKTIYRDLEYIQDSLDKIRYDWEMIVVIDGMIDNTYQEVHRFIKNSHWRQLRVKALSYQQNHGKGYAVRYGMHKATGDYVAFIDAGMDLNPNGLSMLLEHMEWYNADIIIGSKRHPASKVDYPFLRRVYSIGYQALVKILFGLNVTDTQTGMKIFKQQVLKDVMPRLLIKRWAFDIEMLAVAHYLGYLRIYEAPIELKHDTFNSSINKNAVFNMLWDTCAVFYRMYIIHYYDEKNKAKWSLHQFELEGKTA